MPLAKGSSKEAVSKNIKTEMASGKSQKQSVAIAMNVAGKSKNMREACEGFAMNMKRKHGK